MNNGKMKMRATVINDDATHSLTWGESARPTVGEHDVLLRVRATAVNRADLLQRIGKYPPPAGASQILGLEAAGEIVECGASVTRRHVGDRVCALLAGGGYAEFVVCHEDVLLPIGDQMSFEQAAALPEALYTAYLNLFVEGQLQTGERALIHAGASGIGTMAIQLCAAMGSPVYATASASKLPLLRELGADVAIDRASDDFATQIADLTHGKGVDVILDPVGGSYLEQNIRVLARGGRLVVIGLLGGTKGQLSLNTLLMKRQRVIGSVLRNRSVAEKATLTREIEASVWSLIEAGKVRPVIHKTMPIEQAEAAHDLMRRNETTGKLVLSLPE